MMDMPLDPRRMQAMAGAMSKAIPPQLAAQMGGQGGMAQLLKALESMGGGGGGGVPPGLMGLLGGGGR
jgi:hypothetical protein